MVRSRTALTRQPRRGTIAVLVAVCLTMMLSIVALSVDGGLLLTDRRHAQTTADAAAMAAATVLYDNYPNYQGKGPKNVARDAARAVAAANGYSNDRTVSKVDVNIPPQSGPYAGKDGYVEVIVEYQQERAFSAIFGSGTLPVKARAVAQGQWIDPHIGVLILDYESQGALNSQGNGAFTETGGPVIVNSNNPNAFVDTGSGAVKGESFYVTGGVKLANNANLQTYPVAGQVFTGVHPTPDPLAYLPVPDVPADGTMTTTSIGQGNTRYVLTPGRYTNLPAFNTGDEVVLQQASANDAGGIFYIDGGGFKSTGAKITMDSGTSGGVMIYNVPNGTASSQKIQITGNASGTVDLAPLTSGPYSGMVLWQDRTSPVDALVEGNGSFAVRGTFYAAGAKLNVNGNGGTYTGDTGASMSGSLIGSQYVSKDLALGGNGNVVINYFGPQVARTKLLRLVE